jgi:hypothetical protein
VAGAVAPGAFGGVTAAFGAFFPAVEVVWEAVTGAFADLEGAAAAATTGPPVEVDAAAAAVDLFAFPAAEAPGLAEPDEETGAAQDARYMHPSAVMIKKTARWMTPLCMTFI